MEMEIIPAPRGERCIMHPRRLKNRHCRVRRCDWVAGGSMGEVTRILEAVEKGDARAADDLLPIVYQELRRLAADRLAHERPGQTLQPTALVHEAYIRLVGAADRTFSTTCRTSRSSRDRPARPTGPASSFAATVGSWPALR